MKILVHNDYDEMSKAAAELVSDLIRQKPNALLCLPSGDSPTKIFSYLVQYTQQGNLDFSNCWFVGLDEWVGMDENQEGSCKHYMYKNLFIPLKIRPDKIVFFDARASDLDRECKRIDEFISMNGKIDMMMVGIGMNGHIGLNEPGVSPDLYSHYIKIDQVTKTVAQKYFKKETNLTEGITLGLKHLQEAKVAVLIANGIKKAEIIAQSLQSDVNKDIPASIIQKHPESYIFLDREAASKLTAGKQ